MKKDYDLKSKTNQKLILIACVFTFIFGLVFYTAYSYKAGKDNSENTTKNLELPSTSPIAAFTDVNFYACVVDNVNKIAGNQYIYSDVIPDSVLASMSNIICQTNTNISSINGIEKLPNLTSLQILNAKSLTNINIPAANANLSRVNLTGDSIQSFNSETASIKQLFLKDNQLTTINLNNLVNLNYLDVRNNQLTSIDLTNNTSLRSLFLSNNKLTSLNLKNNINLTNWEISNNQFTFDNLTLSIGETKEYVSSVLFVNDYSLVSSNRDVVDIVGHNIKALKEGTATISVVCADFQADFTVTVPAQDTNKTTDNQNNNNTNNNTNSGTTNNNANSGTTNNNTTTAEAKANLSDNDNLQSLDVKEGTIVFNKDVVNYNITVDNNVDKLNIIAKASDDKATVKTIMPDKLEVGLNQATVTVTAQNGSSKVYQLIIKKLAKNETKSNDSKLKSLIANGYVLNFNSNKRDYSITINSSVKSLDLRYITSDASASVTVKNNKNLIDGSIVKIIVVAENGTKTIYTIKIKKNSSYTSYIIIFTILLLIILFFLLFVLKRRKDDDDDNKEKTTDFHKINKNL